MNERRRIVLAALAAPAGLLLAGGCASLLGPRTVTLGEDELARQIEQRFPIDRRLLEMLDMRIARPTVRLLPADNRIGIDVELSLADAISRRAFPLALSLDSALRYDAAQTAVTLADVRVRRLRIDGLPAPFGAVLQGVGAPIAEQVLEGSVVHRFTPEQLQLAAGHGLRPDAIAVTPRGVEVTLLPR